MSEVQKAIEKITYLRDSLPKAAFQVIKPIERRQFHICAKPLIMQSVKGECWRRIISFIFMRYICWESNRVYMMEENMIIFIIR